MLRAVVGIVAWFVLVVSCGPLRAQGTGSPIVPERVALRHGLHRAWVTQIQVDPTRGRLEYVTLDDGMLLVQTDQATVQALDAETQRTLWIVHIGRRNYPTTPPATNDRFVAATNGSSLYLLNRVTGGLVWQKKLDGMPSAGLALSDDRIYVPLTSGLLSSYLLPDKNDTNDPLEKLVKSQPISYHGKGMADAAPVITGTTVAWGTIAGNVYSASHNELAPRFRFRTRASVSAPLAYRAPYVIAASQDGYIYALHEQRGSPRWSFSTGNPIEAQPVIMGDSVYVIPRKGGMFCLSAESGEEQWSTSGVYQFISASPTRLYVADFVGNVLILDAKSGARLSTLPTHNLPLKVVNTQTDRLYLGSTTGVLQCLHEVGLDQPIQHAPAVADEAASEAEDTTDKDPAAQAAAGEDADEADEGDDLFGEEDEATDDAEMPADEDVDEGAADEAEADEMEADEADEADAEMDADMPEDDEAE